jgi:hypothetical protein
MVHQFLRFLLAVWLLAICCAPRAAVYDDFGGDGIDAGKWVRQDGVELFTQSNGRLSFPCKGQATEKLDSTARFAPGFFRLEFRDYNSTNTSPPARGLGSYLALGLAAGDERVRTIRGDIGRGGYFEANYFKGRDYNLWYFDDNADAGQLGLYFDGSAVSFYYKAGPNPAKPWRKIGPTVRPNWPMLPRLYIAGSSGGSGCTRFSVVNVEHIPAPLPASFLQELGH